jgi:serine phosphatase RsbU (regulator of sigma subunit)/anti-sigma regulatory factor (Ser/Thr protein kinase)
MMAANPSILMINSFAPDEDGVWPLLVRHLYKQAWSAQFGAFLVAAVTAYLFWARSSQPLVLGWFAYMTLTMFFRLGLVARYSRTEKAAADADYRVWEQRFYVGVILSACGWGIAGTIFFSPDSIGHQVLLLGVIAGMAGGSIPTLSASSRAASTFLLVSIIPVSVMLLLHDEETSTGMGVLGLVYAALMLRVARTSFQSLHDTFSFRVTNQRLVDELEERTEVLEQYHLQIKSEQELALSVFESLTPREALNASNITYHLSSQSLFNGDLLLVETRPDGKQHVMLGDFTGHGLAASLGALPVSDIFRGMTRKGYAIEDIAAEINHKLYEQLPVNLFLVACLAEVDAVRQRLRVWNGGLPSVYLLYGHNGHIKENLESRHLPLGILPSEDFDDSVVHLHIKDQDQLFMATDGLVEQCNTAGEMFGSERLEVLLNDIHDIGELTQAIQSELDSFCGGVEQTDDITFIAMRAEAVVCSVDVKPRTTDKQSARRHWRQRIDLDAESMRSINPVPVIVHLLQELNGSQTEIGNFELVLGELYKNALDHGVLALESNLKHSSDGFEQYYLQRAERLQSLSDGRITLELVNEPGGLDGCIELIVTDSGNGFDYQSLISDLDQNTELHGRGLALARSLCESVQYEGKGNRVHARYCWGEQSED